MLSDDTLRRFGAVDRDKIEQQVRRLYDLWAQGDMDAMLAQIAPDATAPSNGFWTGVKAPRIGREQVAANLRRAASAMENIVSVLHEIVIDGDRAVVHRTAVGRRRDTGRRYQCDIIDFFRFRDGLVIELSSYPDAAWIEILP